MGPGGARRRGVRRDALDQESVGRAGPHLAAGQTILVFVDDAGPGDLSVRAGCEARCGGRECRDDGCGGSCGGCGPGVCVDGGCCVGDGAGWRADHARRRRARPGRVVAGGRRRDGQGREGGGRPDCGSTRATSVGARLAPRQRARDAGAQAVRRPGRRGRRRGPPGQSSTRAGRPLQLGGGQAIISTSYSIGTGAPPAMPPFTTTR